MKEITKRHVHPCREENNLSEYFQDVFYEVPDSLKYALLHQRVISQDKLQPWKKSMSYTCEEQQLKKDLQMLSYRESYFSRQPGSLGLLPSYMAWPSFLLPFSHCSVKVLRIRSIEPAAMNTEIYYRALPKKPQRRFLPLPPLHKRCGNGLEFRLLGCSWPLYGSSSVSIHKIISSQAVIKLTLF